MPVMKSYILEIYEGKECLVAFESDVPFGAISTGDIINPQPWQLDGMRLDARYIVVEVEHLIWQIKQPRHKIMVHVKSYLPDD